MPSTAAPSPPQRRAATVVRRVREAMLRLTHPVEARISPDGRAVAVAAAGPENVGLVLVPAGPQGPEADAQPPVFLAPPEPSAPTDRHSPRRLPDSRTLLHIAGFEGPAGTEVRLAALDTASGAVRTVAAAPGAVEGLLVSGRAARAAVRCRGIRHGFARCAAAVRLCADLRDRRCAHRAVGTGLSRAPGGARAEPGRGARAGRGTGSRLRRPYVPVLGRRSRRVARCESDGPP
ncbi:hypothetical protein NRF20_40090 [Streptomyces sp. R-74717]|uniref:hypothetical protein n=1 Tax=Streptomyces sp. R-74717 TaxID=2969820 RepID=UPI0039B39D16